MSAIFKQLETNVRELLDKVKALGSMAFQNREDYITQYGCMYISTPIETTVTAINTPVLVAGTFTEVVSTNNFTTSSAGRITYTGESTIRVKAQASISFSIAGSNDDVSYYLALNGSIIESSHQQKFVGTGSESKVISLNGMPELSSDDYLEVYLENNTDTGNVTTEYMNLNIVSVN